MLTDSWCWSSAASGCRSHALSTAVGHRCRWLAFLLAIHARAAMQWAMRVLDNEELGAQQQQQQEQRWN